MTDEKAPKAPAPVELLEELDVGRLVGPGRAPRTIHIEYARDLQEGDIEALALPRGTAPKALMRIHSSHHALARCLASGMKQSQASLVTGYSPARISVLLNDGAFQALVKEYETEARATFADLAERMAGISLDAIELLHERLQEKPADFTIPMLLEVVKSFADRTGYGPGTTLNMNVAKTTDLIDRPPRESFEDWKERRERELSGAPAPEALPPPKKDLN